MTFFPLNDPHRFMVVYNLVRLHQQQISSVAVAEPEVPVAAVAHPVEVEPAVAELVEAKRRV